MKNIYHYCAIYQPAVGQTAYVDGIVGRGSEIVTGEDYEELKNVIKGDIPHSLTIISLTKIGVAAINMPANGEGK
jgi:hypothetical protein